jgi:hypothetical protein
MIISPDVVNVLVFSGIVFWGLVAGWLFSRLLDRF